MWMGFLGDANDLPDEPEEAFGCGVLAGLELVADEVLQGVGLERGGELAVFDFLRRRNRVNISVPSIVFVGIELSAYLDVALHITLDRLESSTTDHIEERSQRLGSLEELRGVDRIVFGGVVVDVGETLAAVEVGAARRECGGHVCGIVGMCVCVYNFFRAEEVVNWFNWALLVSSSCMVFGGGSRVMVACLDPC
jgi:hypothetical protein